MITGADAVQMGLIGLAAAWTWLVLVRWHVERLNARFRSPDEGAECPDDGGEQA